MIYIQQFKMYYQESRKIILILIWLFVSLSVFGARNYGYYLQGNIISMQRQGLVGPRLWGEIDDITARYRGNQLIGVRDDAEDVLLEASMDMASGSYGEDAFGYDPCGNLTRDLSRSIEEIVYDADINKPTIARMAGGGEIRWLYAATGERLAEMAIDPQGRIISRRDYIGGYIFENGRAERLQMPSGYVTLADTVYHAYIHDYAGAIVGVLNTYSGALEQFTDYYPYGMPHAMSRQAAVNRYKHGGKELTTELGLNLYDYHARLYDPVLPRFLQPDPHAWNYLSKSPNSFCIGNPINAVDPSGMDTYSLDVDGFFLLLENTDDDFDRIYSTINDNTFIDVDKNVLSSLQNHNVNFRSSVSESEKGIISIMESSGNLYNEYNFFKRNTLVEWSYVEMSNNEGELNFIGTTHKESLDSSQDLLLDYAVHNGLTINHARHNHTNEFVSPSSQDIRMAEKIQDKFPNATFAVDPSRLNIKAMNYSRSSKPNLLNEIIVTAPIINKKK